MIEHECNFENVSVTSFQDETTSVLRVEKYEEQDFFYNRVTHEFIYDRDLYLRVFDFVLDNPHVKIWIPKNIGVSGEEIEFLGGNTILVTVAGEIPFVLRGAEPKYFRQLLTAYELSLEE